MSNWAKVSDIKAGDKVETFGFTCIPDNTIKEVKLYGSNELYIDCHDGKHFIDGQADDGIEYIGLRKVN